MIAVNPYTPKEVMQSFIKKLNQRKSLVFRKLQGHRSPLQGHKVFLAGACGYPRFFLTLNRPSSKTRNESHATHS